MRVIEVTNLTKAYGPKAVVNDISFTVERGQVCGFLGPNGSGKTTTIGMLLGTVHPSSGDVRLFGTFNPGQFGGARHRLGAALETPSLHPHLSAEDNLRITATIKDTPRARIGAALELVKLTARRHDRVRTFSFGMKQRLALAAALLAEPELVVLDEPTNGLDPEGIHDLREIIRTLAGRGTTVFLSSHLLHEVEQLCTHVVVIHGGRVLRQGSLQALATPGGVTTLRAADLARLRDAVAQYAGAAAIHVHGDTVTANLADPDPAALNRFLAERGIHVSHLAVRRQTVEDIFLDATRVDATKDAGATDRGEVAA